MDHTTFLQREIPLQKKKYLFLKGKLQSAK